MTITDYSFYLAIHAFIRFIGGIVFLDFYFKYRYKRFLLLTFAFVLFTLNPAIQFNLPSLDELILEEANLQLTSKFIFIFSEILMTISVFLFGIVIMNYVKRIKTNIVIGGTSIIIFIPIALFPFISFEECFYLTQIQDLLIIFLILYCIIKNNKQYKKIANNVPIFFLITIIVVLLNLIITLFYLALEDLELLSRIGLTFLVPFVFIHLEYNLLGNQKAILKDNYSHNLSQILQISSGRFYLMLNAENEEEINKEIKNLQTDFEEISFLINKIRKI